MSGIFGSVQFDGRPADRAILGRITAASSHRGPDGSGLWIEDSAALGQQRLHSTPESLQEIPRDDGRFVLALDGRIDNAEELRLSALGKAELPVEPVLERWYALWGIPV